MHTPAHVLSKKSAQQQRNVFIWCGNMHKIIMGLRVNSDSSTSISTVYRWIVTTIQTEVPNFAPESFALFPVIVKPSGVLTYAIQRSGSALPRESSENIVPGDYGVFNEDGAKPKIDYILAPTLSYAELERFFEKNSIALAKKASLPSSIAERALGRDKECVFTGVSHTSDSDTLVVTWVFPPSLGYTLSDDPYLDRTYHDNTDACDLSEFMVVTNTVSGRRDVVGLFCENKLGIDVDDNYRIVIFDNSERMLTPLKSHAIFVETHDRPSDRYLRLHFQRCLTVTACGGNPTEDYEDQEIDVFMEELGVYDDEIDVTDPRWATPLGVEVYAYLLRKKMAEHGVEED